MKVRPDRYVKITCEKLYSFLKQLPNADCKNSINDYCGFNSHQSKDSTGADLSDQDLSCLNLAGANLSYTNCSGNDFSRSNITGTRVAQTKLEGAIIPISAIGWNSLSYAMMKGAYIPDAAVLSKASLTIVKDQGAITTDEELHNAIKNVTVPYKHGYKLAKRLFDIGVKHGNQGYQTTAIGYIEVIYKLPENEMPLAAKQDLQVFEKAHAFFKVCLDDKSILFGIPQDVIGTITGTLFALSGNDNYWSNTIRARQNQEKFQSQRLG